MQHVWPFCLVALLLLCVSACVQETQEAPPAETETPAMEEPVTTAAPDSVTYSITLSGAAEVPGPGDEDGRGTAQITFNQGEVCYDISVAEIGEATAAHIHTGTASESGGPVVNLNVPENTLTGCVSGVEGDLLAQIQANPSAYYLNVHTEEFPAGALRGQLDDR